MTALDRDARSLYLDLMRRNLTRDGMPQRMPESWSLRRRLLFRFVRKATPARWPAEAETMIGMERLTSLQHCVETVLAEDVPGDLIECGVWRGGACIMMRAVLAAHGDETRCVWLADSFAGLPRPNAAKYEADKGLRLDLLGGILGVSEAEVKANFQRYNLLDDRVRFLSGWFKDTLHQAPIDRIAVLRLDGDLYESTIQALDALYPRLSRGGFCVIDDYYAIDACRQAVTDYRKQRGISEEIIDIDWSGVLWRKE